MDPVVMPIRLAIAPMSALNRRRQLDADLGAGARPARDADGSAEAFDDVARDRPPQAGAWPPGCERGVEHARQIFGCNARASIANLDRDPRRPRPAGGDIDQGGAL